MEEYRAIRTWFSSRPYAKKTEYVYLRYVAMFCGLLNKNPDELANVNAQSALKLQIQLANAMKEELHLREYSILQRINTLHAFWRYNGVQLTEDIMKYKGTPTLLRLVKAKISRKIQKLSLAHEDKEN